MLPLPCDVRLEWIQCHERSLRKSVAKILHNFLVSNDKILYHFLVSFTYCSFHDRMWQSLIISQLPSVNVGEQFAKFRVTPRAKCSRGTSKLCKLLTNVFGPRCDIIILTSNFGVAFIREYSVIQWPKQLCEVSQRKTLLILLIFALFGFLHCMFLSWKTTLYYHRNWLRPDLTHWSLNKMANILQMTLSNAFSSVKIIVIRFKFL